MDSFVKLSVENKFYHRVKAIIITISLGCVFPIIYYFLLAIFILFHNTGFSWLFEGTYTLFSPIFLMLMMFSEDLKFSLLAFSGGSLLAGLIGILIYQLIGEKKILVGLFNGILGIIIVMLFIPKELSKYVSDNIVIYYIPGFFLILILIIIGLHTHKIWSRST